MRFRGYHLTAGEVLREAAVMVAVSRRLAKGYPLLVTLVNLNVETNDCVDFDRFTML